MKPLPERYALFVVSAFIFVIALAPFDFSVAADDLPSRMINAAALDSGCINLPLAARVGAFLILGVLIDLAFGRVIRSMSRVRLAAIVLSTCLALELLKLPQASRHAKLCDWIAHATAAGMALSVMGRSARGALLRSRLLEALRRNFRMRLASVVALASLAWISAVAYPALRLPQVPWDPTMRLSVANEPDHSRPWLGDLFYLGVYDRPLSQAEILEVTSQSSRDASTSRRHLGLVLGYDFAQTRAGVVPAEGSLASPTFDLEVPKDGARPDFVRIHLPATLTPTGSSRPLTDRLSSAGAFTIETWIHPLNAQLEGPARIITLSHGPYRTNTTLAQTGADLEFRVRNGISGSIGIQRVLQARDVFDDQPIHVFATYDHGVSTIRDATGAVHTLVDLRDPLPYLGLTPHLGGRVAAALLLAGLIALPVSLLLSNRSSTTRHAAALAALSLAAALPLLVSTAVTGGPVRPGLTWMIAAIGSLAYPLLLRFVTPPATAAPV